MATAPDMKPMELEGRLKAFKFAEVLQFLAMGRMTGVLSITRDDRCVELGFKEGRVIAGATRRRSSRLGQMLVYAGHLKRQALEEALGAQEASNGEQLLGEILIERNLVEASRIREVLQLQLQEEIWDLFGWEDGYFRFEQEPPRESASIEVYLDIEPLLLEGSRRLDEWDDIQSCIQNPREVYRVNPEFSGAPESPLDEATWGVLSWVNGRLSVEAITRLGGLGKFETYWALRNLLQAEMIVPVSEGSVVEETPSFVDPHQGTEEIQAEEIRAAEVDVERADTGASFLRLFGRKKQSSGGSGESRSGATAGVQGKGDDPYATDVGLVCAAVNQLIDVLTSDSKFLGGDEPSAIVDRLWRETEERFPKADLIRVEGRALDASRFERYVEREGGLSPALNDVRQDGLDALRLFWDRLSSNAKDRLDERAADQIVDKALRPYLKASAVVQGPEFSIDHWRKGTV